ncbi:MAG: hypothetical protein LKI92_02445, partial [Schleiferilactobacillus harbinensis]|nr:hypothetical protein [Schleiferilactobacillus harbinensis]
MTKKFWQLSPAERRVLLVDQGILTQAQADFWSTQTTLPETVLLGLSENNIGQMSLPVGVVPNVQIAGKAVTIPLATEEPSVVAAISHGFKMMNQGRTIQVVKNIHGVTGQIGLQHVSAKDLTILQDQQADLQRIGLAAHPTLTSHDGAIRQIQIKRVGQSDAAIIVTVD